MSEYTGVSLFPREEGCKDGGGGQVEEELFYTMFSKVPAQLWRGRMLGHSREFDG